MSELLSYKIHIKGLVQGVGFRPFIYRLAKGNNLNGTVENNNSGVDIEINASPQRMKYFIDQIWNESPPAAKITSIDVAEQQFKSFSHFTIKESTNCSNDVTGISPDIAVCQDCLNDMQNQPHRIHYPFVNCTNCGPRFTIIKDIPYDRIQTSMGEFEMCHQCKKEYHDIDDRRFHAQPVACKQCGPSYSLFTGNADIIELEDILSFISKLVNEGEIFAIKGIGGFHLACDARNNQALKRLREIKNRDSKPFAVMCRDMQTVFDIAEVSSNEQVLLASWQKPIVLLKSKNNLGYLVQNGLNTIGVMLPYMPIHYMLFERIKTNTLVLTSGNFSDEPIIISNASALEQFRPKIMAIVTYNREIYNRIDDSVVQSVNNRIAIVRRSRGYVPFPIELNFNSEGIFAAGAELVNAFAIGKANHAILSQHIGDLKNAETLQFFEESYLRFSGLFRFNPQGIACDLHPDYLSTQFAKNLAQKFNIPLHLVQHHHAHIASVMGEYNINEKVIGICMDGIGYGPDGNIWGAEFMLADYKSCERLYHFENISLAGGDTVSVQPWRSAVSYLIVTGNENYLEEFLSKNNELKKQEVRIYSELLSKKINCMNYSSAGRLFDAVAALTGACINAGFHAEAPMRLESIIDFSIKDRYKFNKNPMNINFSPMFAAIIADLKQNLSAGFISAKFHNTLISLFTEIATDIRNISGYNKVVLCGGTFQNKYLAGNTISQLSNQGFEVFFPSQVPVNDGGIALGQLSIAAFKQNL